ncbi:hypothetical protein [Mycoplasma phocoeninasale]|uniref:hypothetical protein n=1 Tax=Mycoplasma phocoeninasale TaxID=2726117 RepID=UPI0023F95E99|nr:hypothetical protein [Mycoplasma phocoeninasale]
MLSSVYNTVLAGYMPDYTCLVTSLFRHTESYLHQILDDWLKNSTSTPNGKNKFNYFLLNQTTNLYEYNDKNANLITSIQKKYLNELYSRYNKLRHPFSHWSENSVDAHVIVDIK